MDFPNSPKVQQRNQKSREQNKELKFLKNMESDFA